jgi:hypothetical protein
LNNSNPKYSNSNESSTTSQPRGEKPYKGDYSKRHQPSQHTLSSFFTLTDKSKFDDSKSSTKKNSQLTTKNAIDTNDNAARTDEAIEQISQQTENFQISDPSQQLTVYMNPSAYNPIEFNTSPKAARFFVIKSYSEDDIHRSIKYNIWCSTEHGNRRLDSAYFRGNSISTFLRAITYFDSKFFTVFFSYFIKKSQTQK